VTVAAALITPMVASLGDDTGCERAFVEHVVDGDTIRVACGSRHLKVRMIGVDAPEISHPDRAGEPFGREAAEHARKMLARQTVKLEYDGTRRDRYGRTLAYVRLANGELFNEEIIRAGYATVYERFEFRHKEEFRAAQREARAEHRGMWATGGEARQVRVIGNSRSRIYHLPGQKHYDEVAERNRVYFDSEDAARAAGYRPAAE
jgi:micrococcal nuclease